MSEPIPSGVPFPVINDNYHFECTMCGNCCTGDQRVQLDLYDLYKMARFHKFSETSYLFEKNWIELVESKPKFYAPQIRFKKYPTPFCPFLINELDDDGNLKGLCRLHPDHKPLICTLSPVGHIVDMHKNKITYVYVNPAPDCPGVKSTKNNSLERLRKEWAPERAYQRRFFRLAERIVFDFKGDPDRYRRFYSINTETPFETILNQKEQFWLSGSTASKQNSPF